MTLMTGRVSCNKCTDKFVTRLGTLCVGKGSLVDGWLNEKRLTADSPVAVNINGSGSSGYWILKGINMCQIGVSLESLFCCAH